MMLLSSGVMGARVEDADRTVLSVASRIASGEMSTPTARVLPGGQR